LGHLRRRAVRGDFRAELFTDLSGFAGRTQAAPWAGRGAFENCINECAADGFVRYLIGGQVELQEAHRAFDVHATGPG